MKQIAVVMVGFGNVGQAFARLLLRNNKFCRPVRPARHRHRHHHRRHGGAINSGGINLTRALETLELGQSLDILSEQPVPKNVTDFIFSSSADAMLETSPVNHHTGQPAIDHIKTAANKGMHAITANKGPVVHAFAELNKMAAMRGKRFMYEFDGDGRRPDFSLFRGPLPAADLLGFSGILNSCTNFMLGLLEKGMTLDEAIVEGQKIGITETDPSADIDGWDAAIKVAALITVLMGIRSSRSKLTAPAFAKSPQRWPRKPLGW